MNFLEKLRNLSDTKKIIIFIVVMVFAAAGLGMVWIFSVARTVTDLRQAPPQISLPKIDFPEITLPDMGTDVSGSNQPITN